MVTRGREAAFLAKISALQRAGADGAGACDRRRAGSDCPRRANTAGGGLANLMELDLSNTQVTDAGLVHLKGLISLWKLDLSGTQVTDAGLKHMTALANLRYILLDRTQVTDAGVKELKQALPSLTIFR
jgi:Leucine-rich repeat (LRR) protein